MDPVPYPMEQVSNYESKWNSDAHKAKNRKYCHCGRL